MRVAYFHYGILEGGDSNGWYRTFELAKGLRKLGHQVDLYTTGPRPEFGKLSIKEMDGVKVLVFGDVFSERFQRGGFSLSTIVRKTRYAMTSELYDLTISDNVHRPTCLLPASYLKLVKNIPMISEWWELFGKGGIYSDLGWSHRLTVGFYDLLLEKSMRMRCDGLAPISEYLGAEARSMGFNHKKIEVIHAGSLEQVCESERFELSNPKDELRIGLIGFNRDELANNFYLFEVVKELNSQGYNIKVFCSGKKKLQSIIPSEYVDFVELLGWVDKDEFVQAFNSCHVLTLIQEDKIRNRARFPNKFGDYLSFQGVVLTNAIGDLAQYVQKYPNKVKFVESKEGIKLILESIIENGMPILDSRICEENTWVKRAKQLENLFNRI